MISRKAMRPSSRNVSRAGRVCRTVSITIRRAVKGPAVPNTICAPENEIRRFAATLLAALCFAVTAKSQENVTFYRDVLPILQQHCQACHRAGEMAPVQFETYRETRPFASAIKEAVLNRTM